MPSVLIQAYIPRRKVRFVTSLLTCLALCIAGLVAFGLMVSAHSETTKMFTAVGAEEQGRDEIRISLNSTGFEPQQVQHAAGTFAIAVENSVHSSEYSLRLKATDGTVLKEVQVQKGSSAFSVSLAAGTYTLTEPDNPSWVCTLTIQ